MITIQRGARKSRGRGTAGLTVAVQAILALAVAGPAAASSPATVTGMQARASGVTPAVVSSPAGPVVSGYQRTKCMATSGGSDASGTLVIVGDCDGSAGQDWTIGADGTIRTAGMCLDVLNQGTASKTPVDLGTCTGGASQRWTAAGGTIVNAASGKCLDDPRWVTADGTGLEIYACNAGANQLWSPKSWNLTTDFARHPAYNPAPDFYGDHGTWSFEYGTQGQPDTFELDTFNKAFDADCHVRNVFLWSDGVLDPYVAYNSGPPIVGVCGGDAENWPGEAVNVSPGAVTGPGSSVGVDSVIGWKSPMTGRVTVTTTIKGVNRFEQGVTWELYEGGVDLTGPVTENHDQLSTIGPLSVPVTSGQSLYLEIGSGSNDGDFDDCTLTLTIEA